MSNRYEDPGKQRANETTTPESKYPYNQVYQTAGGIRVIVGNEPGMYDSNGIGSTTTGED